MKKRIGILTSGGDCPGLNAAIRGVARAARSYFGIDCIGFRDGFRGLVQDRTFELTPDVLSGILTDGGTILGTSRDKPHRMPADYRVRDMTDAAVATYRRRELTALVCIGGGGTQKNALKLKEAGLNVVMLPKTIDNDVALTDVSFGFDTALNIVTEAVDRLHSTAMSHQRVIVVEVMGHRAGWLALGGGIAGGADVILIPEIPYDAEIVAGAIERRAHAGKTFSIVVVAEGAMSKSQANAVAKLVAAKGAAQKKADKKTASVRLDAFHAEHVNHTVDLTHRLEELTGLETRLTILGHLQRGGTPSAADRILATRLGTACAQVLSQQTYGVMVAARGRGYELIPLAEVAGKKKLVTLDYPWVQAARHVGVCLGDE
ncbi:MAG: 6-phosphofructokinase [Sedimentisphaerales bacterium]|nr:6-phosphofructokinase [Sedimentisphaerales bacterium]